MDRLRLACLALSTGLLIGACTAAGPSPSASPGVTGSPAASASPSPPASPAIEHPSGAADLVLRMSTGGGFIAPGALLTEIPEFSLFGDGTVIYRGPGEVVPDASPADGIPRNAPFQTARLSEATIQALLAYALGPGGLATARDQYTPCCIADAPSTIFTIRAGAVNKLVTVGALGMEEPSPGPDTGARAAFAALAARLTPPDLGGAVATTYEPAAYRGILSDAVDGGTSSPAIDWPWTAFGPSDFSASGDPNAMPTPTRTLTASEVAALQREGLEGGADSIPLHTSDGHDYLLSLRPLLPDERR